MYPCLRLKKNEERRILANHLWIFSNEVDTTLALQQPISPGSLVTVESHRGKRLGIAYYNPHTLLCARLLTKENVVIDRDFFSTRLQEALRLRELLFQTPYYRLVYGEADSLPGLIMDRYDDILVVQITTLGLWQLRAPLIDAIQSLLQPKSILIKTTALPGTEEGLPDISEIIGEPIPAQVRIEENGIPFIVNLNEGQKTGWFYDQRRNHAELQSYVANRRVLDLFSYVGGFGIHAAMANAKEVVCVDRSAKAIELAALNARMNGVDHIVRAITSDVMDYLKALRDQKSLFDVIILDPPAFIKRRKDIKTGTEAYQRLHELALSVLADDGFLITCSCSMHFPLSELIDCTRRASIKTQTDLQILSYGFQGPDHPIHPAIPETAYLKALFCHKKAH